MKRSIRHRSLLQRGIFTAGLCLCLMMGSLWGQTLTHTESDGTVTYTNGWNPGSTLTITGGQATFTGGVRNNTNVYSTGGLAIFQGPLQNNVQFFIAGGDVQVDSIQNNANFQVSSGSITFNEQVGNNANIAVSGGTVTLGADNVFNESTNLTMSGGTLATQGYDVTFGSLTLNGDSVLDLGDNPDVVVNLGSISGSGNLTVTGWTDFNQIQFNPGDSVSGVANQISFYPSTGSIVIGDKIVPINVIPEPSTYLAGFLLLSLAGWFEWKRRRA